jgi:hypothetical protein
MKNPVEVLRAKEQELLQVKREIEALRVALPLLGGNLDDDDLAAFATQVPASPARKLVQLP